MKNDAPIKEYDSCNDVLVTGDTAVNCGFLAGVDNQEGQTDG